MVIHVKDEETDALVRQLADSRGIGITAAIREAVTEALADDHKAGTDRAPLEVRLQPLLDRLDKLPRPDAWTDKAFFDREWGEVE